jgi:hypothetical protein
MAFTDNCELYGAVHEEGANRVIRHLMLQRPSMFNYATADIAGNKELWCEPVEFTSDVTKYANPIFTVLPPLPVLGVDSPPVGLSFCVQLLKFELDVHKGTVFGLPPDLAPLQEQHFAFHFRVCGGLGCPDNKVLEQVPVLPPGRNQEGRDPLPPVHVRGRVECFCLEVYVVGHVEHAFILGQETLLGKVDGVEIVDIKPEELENSIECYIRTAITLTLRQKLAIPLATFLFSFPLFGMGTVTLSPTPNPPVPNNPAIEEDQLKVFITMTT